MGAHAEGAQAGTHPGPFEVNPASAGDKIKELPAALASILIILTQQDRRGTWSWIWLITVSLAGKYLGEAQPLSHAHSGQAGMLVWPFPTPSSPAGGPTFPQHSQEEHHGWPLLYWVLWNPAACSAGLPHTQDHASPFCVVGSTWTKDFPFVELNSKFQVIFTICPDNSKSSSFPPVAPLPLWHFENLMHKSFIGPSCGWKCWGVPGPHKTPLNLTDLSICFFGQ